MYAGEDSVVYSWRIRSCIIEDDFDEEADAGFSAGCSLSDDFVLLLACLL